MLWRGHLNRLKKSKTQAELFCFLIQPGLALDLIQLPFWQINIVPGLTSIPLFLKLLLLACMECQPLWLIHVVAWVLLMRIYVQDGLSLPHLCLSWETIIMIPIETKMGIEERLKEANLGMLNLISKSLLMLPWETDLSFQDICTHRCTWLILKVALLLSLYSLISLMMINLSVTMLFHKHIC